MHCCFRGSLKSLLFLPPMASPPKQPRPPQPNEGASLAKWSRRMTTCACEESAIRASFERYAQYLNDLNEKRERVVKASRDVTINSKKVIFTVHRISRYNREEVSEKAEKDLLLVADQYMARLVSELQGCDFWKLRRAYSPAVQEYVEAASLCKFCKSGTLLTLSEINRSLLYDCI